MTETEFKNCKGTGDNPPNQGGQSWHSQYVDDTGSERKECAALGCSKPGTHGAHVHEAGEHEQFIVPMCPTHNNPNNTENMELKGNTILDPVKK